MFGLFRRLGSRDAKPNPDAFWSDKWGWMDEASPADLLAVVRRGVESGTIKGKVEETVDCSQEHRGHSSMEVFDLDPGTYLVIGPVSDGGSET